MSDTLYPNNSEDMSLDELLEDAKKQLNSEPGEMDISEEEIAPMPEKKTEDNPQPLEISERPFFEPDFGDAFRDYGTYEEPINESTNIGGAAEHGAFMPENDFSPAGDYLQDNGYAPAENFFDRSPENRESDFFAETPYADEPVIPQPYEEMFSEPDSDLPEDFRAAPYADYPPEPENDNEDDYDEDYDEYYDDEDAPPPAKPREKGKKRLVPLPVKILLYVVIVGLIAVGLGYGAWECAQDFLAFGRSDETIFVTIKEDDTVDDIAQMLKENGVIKYPWFFKLYCDFTDNNDTMDPGTYQICFNYDYHALVNGMVEYSPNRSTVRVMIPEGMTCAQIFALMEKEGVCEAAELEACAAETEFDYWFLEGIPYGDANRLEGFLFPDTYDFYEADNPERVLDKLLSNFEKKFSEEAQAQLEVLRTWFADELSSKGYDEEYISEHPMGLYQLITIASMIEKESAGLEESGEIASVIFNRLLNPEYFPFLNIDASIVYALGGIDGELTASDLEIDSPYNTYNRVGLPIGPISNPGLSSITAALNPDDTEYFYYALDKSTGFHHFSKTYNEHNAFLESQNNGEE